MNGIPQDQQLTLVDRLTQACGGSYTPEVRRRYFITGPQWAVAYEGQAVFHAPVRTPITFDQVIEGYSKLGVNYWCTHDTDVIPTADLFTPRQDEIVGKIKASLKKHGLKCSMVTTETFHHPVWAAGPAAESPAVRDYARNRVINTVGIGHELEAQYCVYWPGMLGYYVQGIIDETQTLRWFAEGVNAACEADIEIAKSKKRPTLKHAFEAKPFEPQGEIILPTSDAMLAFISSGLLTHPDMVGLNPEYLHELMWGRRTASGAGARSDVRQAVSLRYQRRLSAEARCRYCHWTCESAGLAECSGSAALSQVRRPVQSRLQAAAHDQQPRLSGRQRAYQIDRFITLWEMAGEVISDPIMKEATDALKAGGTGADPKSADSVTLPRANCCRSMS